MRIRFVIAVVGALVAVSACDGQGSGDPTSTATVTVTATTTPTATPTTTVEPEPVITTEAASVPATHGLEYNCSDPTWRDQMGAEGDRLCGGARPGTVSVSPGDTC